MPQDQSAPIQGGNAGDELTPYRYTAALAGTIEPRWQEAWASRGTFRVPNPGQVGFDASKPKFYCLDMFPYPSGAGLHIGHPEGYTATDIVCRFKRAKGFNVLHPMGWDAFGLPAEQYAIQTGVHPAITTRKAIDNFRRQLQRFGFCYDWSREFGTIDEAYYRWTQWIFLKLYDAWFDHEAGKARPISELIEREKKAGRWDSLTADAQRTYLDSQRLAYISETTVNWCPKLGTVLANDEVIDGRSERGGFPVLRKPLRQWMFRITAYAERLLAQLKDLDWPASTKAMQEDWIGKSSGAEIEFPIQGDHTLRVFTTRPDTIFGATYMVVAPEHELCEHIAQGRLGVGDANRYQLRQYCEAARNRSDVERQESKEKTGVFTGVHAINPATGAPIPVWAADYVLAGYGTGAIMAVPAHDDRDFAFAKTFDLPIVDVVYTRAELAMAYFVQNSIADEQTDERFAGVLADFLGLVTSTQADPDKFDQLISVIRTRRMPPSGGGTSIPIHLNEPPSGRPASIGERRGVTKIVWLDALEDLGFTTFDTLRETFEARTFHARRGEAWTGPGFAINSSNDHVSIDGLHADEAKARIGDWLEASGLGRRKVNYKLRDWTFSRQRYWGEPFPIVYDKDGRAYPVRESALPVKLPELADYAPVESENPQPLLAKATAWMNTTAGAAGVDPALLPPQTPVTRETNTMPGSAGSSWYAVRYTDPRCASAVAGADAERYWIKDGVDLYIGGSEHAVGHLLYARFWHNVLFDLGALSGREPFRKLVHQGLITSFAFQRPDKTIVAVDEVREVVDGDKTTHIEIATGKPVSPIVTKMSKRYKNVINPDDVIGEFGADTCRLYEMYMGPLEASKPWNPRDIAGCFRFLQRAWRLCVDEKSGTLRAQAAKNHDIEKQLHRLVAKAEGDIERLSFNTAIAAMMEFVNAATTAGGLDVSQIQRFALVLCPFAPHLAEEIYAKAAGVGLASESAWPTVDPALLVDATIEIPVQIMGKVRARIQVPRDADQAAVEAAVMADPKVKEQIGTKAIKKVIVVPGKLVNLVIG
ncbi:MAG: class I tRNA ligase family protein [Phycisphaerales bacterium]|nr:class I tRNA ligase family protein [Phycisphaerales bacterium]